MSCSPSDPAPALAAPRLARLRAACADAGVDAFLVRDSSNVAWLTALDGVFDDEAAHALLVTSCDAVLHTDSRYAEAARAVAAREGAVAVDDSRSTHAAFAEATLRGDGDPSGEGTARYGSLGIEDSIALVEYRRLEATFAGDGVRCELRETSGLVRRLRAAKEPSEIARLRAAQAVTDAAFAHIVGFMRPGLTEREVQIELEDFMRRHGAEGLAFPSIVATGANAASPHAVPGDAKLEAGQCVVLDFGARAHGYCTDMTRTVFLGAPSDRMRAAYEAVRAANERAEALLKPGITGKEAHELAEAVLAEHGFGGAMGHSLGHGVGIDIHEEPNLSPRNDEPLAVGNVVTVEPGVYLPGEFGMRLEDFGVVVEGGFEVFTRSLHDMVVL